MPPTSDTVGAEQNSEADFVAHRISKACENCRAKKIRCSGEVPCKTCTTLGKTATCYMRVKARPNRAISARARKKARSDTTTASQPPDIPKTNSTSAELPKDSTITDGLEFLQSLFTPVNYPTTSSSSTQPQNRIHPLDQLAEALNFWGMSSGVSIEDIMYHDDAAVSQIPAPPLPPHPDIIAFEDGLIAHLCTTPDLERLETIDRSNLYTLYSRYRALPETLTGDQKGLIYAALCSARANARKKGIGGETREDVTYNRMAMQAIEAWGRPSTTALWALFCLVDYAIGNGAAHEQCTAMRQMAWQVEALGLHKRATAHLYPSHELAGPLAAAFFYQDSFRASLTDLKPLIPSSIVDAELILPEFWAPKESVQAAAHSSRYLQDYNDPSVDITSDEYVLSVENEWSEALADLRRQTSSGIARVKHAWGEIWYHWLRILLYLPRLRFSQARSSQAIMILARSASNILSIYAELADMGALRPSWPQMKRIVVSGQVLVLCCARGELHQSESTPMFHKLLDLLEKHRPVWPSAGRSVVGFYKAAKALDITLTIDPPSVTNYNIDLPDLWLGDGELTWSGLFHELAPTTLFNLGDPAEFTGDGVTLPS